MNTGAAHESVQKDEPRRPIRVKDAADLVGVTPKTIRNWVDAGKIPGYRFSYRRMIVDLDDIEPLIGYKRIVPKGSAA